MEPLTAMVIGRDVCGVTTTSGLAWKIPGRVGDSPILGAGLYVANDHGAAGSTGRGEANLYNLALSRVEDFDEAQIQKTRGWLRNESGRTLK